MSAVYYSVVKICDAVIKESAKKSGFFLFLWYPVVLEKEVYAWIRSENYSKATYTRLSEIFKKSASAIS